MRSAGRLLHADQTSPRFADARTDPVRQLGGVTTFLHKKQPATMFPHLGKKRYFAMGTRAHRDIHHVLFCKTAPCRCPADKTIKTWRRPAKGTAAPGDGGTEFSETTSTRSSDRRDGGGVPGDGHTTGLSVSCWKTGYDQLAMSLPETLLIQTASTTGT